MKVHLRKKKKSNSGKLSLFIEVYKGQFKDEIGKIKNERDYLFLDLYVFEKPKTKDEKEHNKHILSIAEKKKLEIELEIAHGKYGITNIQKNKINFVQYFREKTEDRVLTKNNYGNWLSAFKHLHKFTNGFVAINDVDDNFCERFKKYLELTARKSNNKKLSSSSCASYYLKLKACLNHAVKERIILANPSFGIPIPTIIESERNYLTLEEIKALVKTECRYDFLKNAFIFSCLTGLRWSDVNNLTWGQIQKENDDFRITFHQQKTKGLEYLDIPNHSIQFLGELKLSTNEKIFIGLKYSSYINVALSQWVLKAGITKSITFHCARHTYAVLQLSLGTDIYTLSKLLGHKHLKTTQIYAKVMDLTKRDAVNKIPSIF